MPFSKSANALTPLVAMPAATPANASPAVAPILATDLP